MKTLLKAIGLEGLLRLENKSLGLIEISERSSFDFFNLISQEEIMKDLQYGVK